MAGVGLEYNVYATLTEDFDAGTVTYGPGKRGRKMIRADIKLNYAKAPLYGDNTTVEYAREFIDGEITINQDELTSTMRKDLLGNQTKSETLGENTLEVLTGKDDDTPPFVGFGYIQSKTVDNTRQYRAIWYKKVQFGEPDESAETKGESIVWQTPTIVGNILKAADGEWKEEITVPALSTAIAWLKNRANIT